MLKFAESLQLFRFMRRMITPLLLLLLMASCKEEPAGKDGKLTVKDIKNPNSLIEAADDLYPVMQFEEDHFDFGTLQAGEVVSHEFRFKNTGKAPLIITSASSSCGCTVPSYPRDPIAPGEEGVIKVEFDSGGRRNKVKKTVNISANTNPAIQKISIEAFVKTN